MAVLKGSRVGEWAVLLYLLATYVPQFVLHVFDEDALIERFRIGTGTQGFAVLVPLFYLLVLAIQKWFPHVSAGGRPVARVLARVYGSRLNTLLGLGLVGLAANFMVTEGVQFRQTGDIMSEAGVGAAAMMFSKPYIAAWVLYHYLLMMRGEIARPWRARLQALLFLIALILSVTSAFDIIPIAWTTIFTVVGPKRIRPLLVAASPQRMSLRRVLLAIFVPPLLACVCLVMIFVGYVNKTGYDALGEVVERIGYMQILETTAVRLSSSYAALISFVDNNLYNPALYEQIAAVPLENVPYRLSLITGSPLPRPDITQIARLNFLNYEQDPGLERAGASPGLVASALYAGPFPLGFLLMAAYVVIIIRIANVPFRSLPVKPRVGAIAVCACFIYPLFETPVDYLVFIDPAFLQLLLVLGAFLAAGMGRPVAGTVAAEQRGPARGDVTRPSGTAS